MMLPLLVLRRGRRDEKKEPSPYCGRSLSALVATELWLRVIARLFRRIGHVSCATPRDASRHVRPTSHTARSRPRSKHPSVGWPSSRDRQSLLTRQRRISLVSTALQRIMRVGLHATAEMKVQQNKVFPYTNVTRWPVRHSNVHASKLKYRNAKPEC